jgi:hypothetical protein
VRKYTVQDVIASLENALEISLAANVPEKITQAVEIILGETKEGE